MMLRVPLLSGVPQLGRSAAFAAGSQSTPVVARQQAPSRYDAARLGVRSVATRASGRMETVEWTKELANSVSLIGTVGSKQEQQLPNGVALVKLRLAVKKPPKRGEEASESSWCVLCCSAARAVLRVYTRSLRRPPSPQDARRRSRIACSCRVVALSCLFPSHVHLIAPGLTWSAGKLWRKRRRT